MLLLAAVKNGGITVGSAVITEELQLFLKREIEQREDIMLNAMQTLLIELLNVAFDRRLPIEQIPSLSYFSATQYEINASSALLITLNACSISLKKVASFDFSNQTSFANFLRRNCPQRFGAKNCVLYSALSFLNLSDQCFDLFDFYGANLAHTIFDGARLYYSNLGHAILFKTSFVGSILNYSDIGETHIIESNFTNALFHETSLNNLQISNSNFMNASFRAASFEFLEAKNSSFEGANFKDATLSGHIRFSECNFSEIEIGEKNNRLKLLLKNTKISKNSLADRAPPDVGLD
ncbi:pentapeptide repeat-containing protein [Undibacterium sp. Ji49W]|uniref:pentapeptide repeat-containing protein n=1 Tax=Undibacterium sp. Ji49W TaxID=3413040 RepID=UPI003BF0719F